MLLAREERDAGRHLGADAAELSQLLDDFEVWAMAQREEPCFATCTDNASHERYNKRGCLDI